MRLHHHLPYSYSREISERLNLMSVVLATIPIDFPKMPGHWALKSIAFEQIAGRSTALPDLYRLDRIID